MLINKISDGWFLKEFCKTIKLPKRKSGKPVILAVAGPSRVGKTTVLKFVEKKLPYFVHISHDAMRLFLYKNGWLDEGEVDDFIYKSAPSYVFAERFLGQGYSVVFDDNFASKPMKLKKTQELARKFKTRFFVVRVWAPPELIKARLKKKVKPGQFLKTSIFKDWQMAWNHFERSRKQFDYEKFNRYFIACVNSFKPLPNQLKKAIEVLKKEMEG